jgi:hypothetical protein
VNFVDALEIDATTGNVLPGAQPISLHNTVPAYSQLEVHFSEPMAADSFLQWESFRVAFNPDTGVDTGNSQELLTDVVLDPNQTTATIRPVRVDQGAGTVSVVGWGKSTKNLQLILRTVPKTNYLQQFMSSDQVSAFLDQGYRGLLDLGGQPLAFPNSKFDPNNPVIKYNVLFNSSEAATTVVPPPPAVSSWGVIVHRMRGRPLSGVDPATGLAGVGFKDQVNYYRPIADVNLQVNGVLAGSPVVYLTKITDDFFPPPHGQFGKFPLGVPEPLSTPNWTGSSPTAGAQPHDGARFQTLWRDIDCSPNRDSLKGTLLDLYRVSWAPIGGNVTTDNYDNVSLHCAHSPLRPKTTQNTAAASYPYSGLAQPFDYNNWVTLVDPNQVDACPDPCWQNSGPNYWDTLVTVVSPGTKYKVTQSNLFAPPFDGNAYHPWPSFTTKFQYNNGDIPQAETDLRTSINNSFNCSGGSSNPWDDNRQFNSNPDEDNYGGDSLLLEVRVRPQTTTISRQNGFTMAVGVLIDFNGAPSFRTWSEGSTVDGNTVQVNPDDVTNDQYARCALGATQNPSTLPPGYVNRHGDNSRYFSVFDYVKTTSRITSPFVRVWPSNTVSPDYFPPLLFPPASQQPAGTTTTLLWAGANDTKGTGATFASSIDSADGFSNLAFQVTFVGNTKTLLLPNFETVAIPFLRPQGQ